MESSAPFGAELLTGEMRARVRAFDWSATSLGSFAGWPQSLKTAVDLVLASPVPMALLWGTDGVMLYNDAYRVFAGERHPRLFGCPVLEGWPEVAAFNRRVMEVGLAGGTLSFRDEPFLLDRHGTPEEAWLDLSYSPVPDESGRPAGVLAIVIETTERVLSARQEHVARQQAELQKQHLLSVFMQAPNPMVVLRGPDFVIEVVSPLACEIWGRERDAVIGRPLFDAVPEIRNQVFRELLEGVYRTGVPYRGREVPARLARPGGTFETVYFTFVYTPVTNVAGEVEGVFVVSSDVTEQVLARERVERAQDRLTFALEAAGVGYWDSDLTTHAAMRSPSHDRIFGYSTPLPEWTFERFLEHVDPGDRADVAESFARATERGEDWHFECRIIANGAPRRIVAHGRNEPSSDGTAGRMLGIVMDVTERMQLLDRELEARVAADQANRAKDEFLAMLGHELRNPLAPIRTALQLMQLRGDGSAERERTIIQRQVDQLTRLVDDLLDVSRVARGTVHLKRERVEVAEVVAEAIETVSPLLEQRAHALVVEVPRTGLAVDGDPARLAQVVSNLLTNAAKYTPAGGRITVRAALEGEEIALRVRDTGIGIAPELLPRMFDLFVQGWQSLDRSQGGLGLGLTIARSLVAMHGGTVSAHTEGPGLGSELVVRLPQAVAASQSPAGPASPVEPRTPPVSALRVLVVDDNEDAADLLARALAHKGHETRVAHDGPEALRLAEAFRPCVALLDIGLPVMNGYELAAHLRELPGLEHLRLVAVTGYGQETDRERSRAAGFDGHLVKPIDLDALDRALALDAA